MFREGADGANEARLSVRWNVCRRRPGRQTDETEKRAFITANGRDGAAGIGQAACGMKNRHGKPRSGQIRARREEHAFSVAAAVEHANAFAIDSLAKRKLGRTGIRKRHPDSRHREHARDRLGTGAELSG
jgi:hypothetical protein